MQAYFKLNYNFPTDFFANKNKENNDCLDCEEDHCDIKKH